MSCVLWPITLSHSVTSVPLPTPISTGKLSGKTDESLLEGGGEGGGGLVMFFYFVPLYFTCISTFIPCLKVLLPYLFVSQLKFHWHWIPRLPLGNVACSLSFFAITFPQTAVCLWGQEVTLPTPYPLNIKFLQYYFCWSSPFNILIQLFKYSKLKGN